MIIVGRLLLKDHPTAKHLQVGTINGHQVVVGRHYDEGVLGFFIPDGYRISDKLADDLWVKGKLSGKNKDRVKAREMHGVASEGLFAGSKFFILKDGDKIYHTYSGWNSSWVDGQDISQEMISEIWRDDAS